MSVLKSKAGFLTKEERLVFLTVSVCLLGGGIFHMVYSLFDLPDSIDPRQELASSPGLGGRTGMQDAGSGNLSGNGSTTAGLTRQGSLGSWEPEKSWTTEGAPASSAESAYELSLPLEFEDGAGAPRQGLRPASRNRGPASMLELNSATQAELEELPGIGPALAGRILEYRKRVGGFRTVDELLEVKGIGEKTLSRFRACVYVSRNK